MCLKSIRKQFYILQIIGQLGLDGEPFHLIGMSMGGALAGLFAAEYPEHIHCLTLMCPASKLSLYMETNYNSIQSLMSLINTVSFQDIPTISKLAFN